MLEVSFQLKRKEKKRKERKRKGSSIVRVSKFIKNGHFRGQLY